MNRAPTSSPVAGARTTTPTTTEPLSLPLSRHGDPAKRRGPIVRGGRERDVGAADVRAAQRPGGEGLDLTLICALVALAALARWIDLWTIPIFTDEGDEIGLALRIVRDGARPLTNDDPYLGPLFNYLLAGLFWLAGTNPWLPRALMLALGTITIVPAYLLAREIALGVGATRGRASLAGTLAAGLLAVNAGHVLVNSHVAWGNCVTPLLTTTAGWLLVRATRLGGEARRDGTDGRSGEGTDGQSGEGTDGQDGAGRHGAAAPIATNGLLLVLACLAFGLAFQTHPSVVVLLPGVGLFILWQRWRWLTTPWPYLGGIALLAAQAPTLLYIGQHGLAAWLNAIREKQEMYERDGALGLNEIAQRLGQELHALGTVLGGLLNDRDTPPPPLWHPFILLASALAILALFWLARRRQPLIPLVVLFGLLLLPLVNGKYLPLVSNTRYLMPLVIILFAAISAWAACSLGGVLAPLPPRTGEGLGVGASARTSRVPPLHRNGEGVRGWGFLSLAAVLILLAASALSLTLFSVTAHQDGRTNTRLLASIAALEAAYQPGDVVTIDRATYRDWTLTEGRLQRVFESWLEVRGILHRVVDAEDGGRLRTDLAARGGLAVLARRTVPAVTRGGYQLDEIAGDAAPGAPPGSGYTIVRLRR
jgi:4-amino-4-deoxy-L-arabinose transferase-like glycosyltransferase